MTIIEAVVAIIVFGCVILMGAMLIDNEKELQCAVSELEEGWE